MSVLDNLIQSVDLARPPRAAASTDETGMADQSSPLGRFLKIETAYYITDCLLRTSKRSKLRAKVAR